MTNVTARMQRQYWLLLWIAVDKSDSDACLLILAKYTYHHSLYAVYTTILYLPSTFLFCLAVAVPV